MMTIALESSVNTMMSRHSEDDNVTVLLPSHGEASLLGGVKLGLDTILHLVLSKLQQQVQVCELVSMKQGYIDESGWQRLSLEQRRSICPLRLLVNGKDGAALVNVQVGDRKYTWLFDSYTSVADLRSYVASVTSSNFKLTCDVAKVKKHRRDPSRRKTVTRSVALEDDSAKLFSLVHIKPSSVIVATLRSSLGGQSDPLAPLKVYIDNDRFFQIEAEDREGLTFENVLTLGEQQKQLIGQQSNFTCKLFYMNGEPCARAALVPDDITEIDWRIVGVNCFAVVVTSCLHETAVALVKPTTSVQNLKNQLSTLLTQMPVESQAITFKGRLLDVDVATMAYLGVVPDSVLSVHFSVKPRLTVAQEARLWQGGRNTDPHEVRITVLLARDLPSPSILGSDTYCRLIFGDQAFATSLSKTTQPVWNQCFTVCILGSITKSHLVTAEIWRYNTLLGCCAISLMGLTKATPFRVRYELCLAEQGVLELVLEAVDFDSSLLRDPDYQARAKILLDEANHRAMQSPRTLRGKKNALLDVKSKALYAVAAEFPLSSASFELASASLPGLENCPAGNTGQRPASLTLNLARTSNKNLGVSFSPRLGEGTDVTMHKVDRVDL